MKSLQLDGPLLAERGEDNRRGGGEGTGEEESLCFGESGSPLNNPLDEGPPREVVFPFRTFSVEGDDQTVFVNRRWKEQGILETEGQVPVPF